MLHLTKLSADRLWLNVSKTQLRWLCSTQLLDTITCMDVLVLRTDIIKFIISQSAHDLSAHIIDHELSLAVHTTTVHLAVYNQLHQLPTSSLYMPPSPGIHLQSLDYCNSLLFGISDGLLCHR